MLIRVIALLVFFSFWFLVEQLVNALQSSNKKRPAKIQNKDAVPKETFFQEQKALHKYAFTRALWKDFKLNKKLYIIMYVVFALTTLIFGDFKGIILAIIWSIVWCIVLRILITN